MVENPCFIPNHCANNGADRYTRARRALPELARVGRGGRVGLCRPLPNGNHGEND